MLVPSMPASLHAKMPILFHISEHQPVNTLLEGGQMAPLLP